MNYKDVTFDSVGTVRLYAPPTDQIRRVLNRLYPEPQPPVKTETGAGGKEISMEISDDPDYLALKEQNEKLRATKSQEMTTLAVFRALVVPDEWAGPDQAVVETMQYADPDFQWAPRAGAQGHKLDYIEWCVLESMGDTARYSDALYKLMGIDLDLTAQIEDSFPGDVEKQAA